MQIMQNRVESLTSCLTLLSEKKHGSIKRDVNGHNEKDD